MLSRVLLDGAEDGARLVYHRSASRPGKISFVIKVIKAFILI